jgi:hypothetical protein
MEIHECLVVGWFVTFKCVSILSHCYIVTEHILALSHCHNVTCVHPLQSRGADPSLLTKETDSYLDPGRKGVPNVMQTSLSRPACHSLCLCLCLCGVGDCQSCPWHCLAAGSISLALFLISAPAVFMAAEQRCRLLPADLRNRLLPGAQGGAGCHTPHLHPGHQKAVVFPCLSATAVLVPCLCRAVVPTPRC